jgi:predicted enzyme related to lactoylglutathione lyase
MPAAGAVFYVPSQDLETDLAQVTAVGRQVLLGRTAVDAAHWVAVCADPHGTRFVLVITVAAPRATAPMSAAS